MAEPIANPEECTTPEAWAELVRSERKSALGLMAELARLNAMNAALVGEIRRLNGVIARGQTNVGEG